MPTTGHVLSAHAHNWLGRDCQQHCKYPEWQVSDSVYTALAQMLQCIGACGVCVLQSSSLCMHFLPPFLVTL